jgi:hypothetical protein
MKSEGLERQRWSDPIDDFVREYGGATPRWAIVLTYELDIATLARAVLPALTRRGRRSGRSSWRTKARWKAA